MKSKTSKETFTTTTEIVLPNDTNALGNLHGGKLMLWMDVVSAISASRLCNQVVVTASVNNISFREGIKLGSIVTLEAKVSRSFNTSMEVVIDVWVEDRITGDKKKHNEAIFTFVALEQKNGKPVPVPEVVPETTEEKKRFDGALRRRQLSLILAGKMKPDDATELKALFVK